MRDESNIKGIKPGTKWNKGVEYNGFNWDCPLGFTYAGNKQYEAGHVRTFGTEHFKPGEFKCKCCGGLPENGIAVALFIELEQLRAALGDLPIKIVSGYRCPEYNEKLRKKFPGGVAKKSYHLVGEAADVKVAGVSPERVAEAAAEHTNFSKGGIGVYDTFTHLDVRHVSGGKKARWRG